MYCEKCKREFDENQGICPYCSENNIEVTLEKDSDYVRIDEDEDEDENVHEEGSGIGWGILSFIIPLVGIILFFAWMNYKPKASKAAIIGAILGIFAAMLIRYS